MTIEELNGKFGAPARIVFYRGHAGHPELAIANKYGTAEIALLGANVLSYRPTGHSPVVFRPAKRDYNRSEMIHGGIPVCWPQFGKRFSKDLPQHGFARFMEFEVRGSRYTEDLTEVTLGLKSDAETMKIWPHAFDLEFTVSVSMKLNLKLVTRNTGDAPLEFSCGFHPYFCVRNRDDVTVRGLAGLKFTDDTKEPMTEGVQQGDLKVNFAPDHIFQLKPAPKYEFAILDPGLRRAIGIAANGIRDAVVWNCGAEKPFDFAEDDWKKYVCVEPVSDWPLGRALAPGEKHELTAAIQATLEQ